MGCDVWGSRQKVQLRSKARHREGSVGNREAGGRAGARPTGVRSGERGPWNAGGTSQQSRENSPEPKLCVSRSEALPPAASRRLPARGPREGPTEARGSGNGSRVPGSAGSQRAVPGSRSPSPQAHEQGRAVGRATSPSLTTASRGRRPHLASEETASAARVGHGEPQRAGPRPREDQRGQRLQTHAPREQTRGVGPQSGTVPWAHLRGTGSPPDMNAGHPYYRCCDGTNVFIIHSPALSRVSRMRPRWMCKSVSFRAHRPRDPGSDTARGFPSPLEPLARSRRAGQSKGTAWLTRSPSATQTQGAGLWAELHTQQVLHTGGHVTVPDPVPQFPMYVCEQMLKLTENKMCHGNRRKRGL